MTLSINLNKLSFSSLTHWLTSTDSSAIRMRKAVLRTVAYLGTQSEKASFIVSHMQSIYQSNSNLEYVTNTAKLITLIVSPYIRQMVFYGEKGYQHSTGAYDHYQKSEYQKMFSDLTFLTGVVGHMALGMVSPETAGLSFYVYQAMLDMDLLSQLTTQTERDAIDDRIVEFLTQHIGDLLQDKSEITLLKEDMSFSEPSEHDKALSSLEAGKSSDVPQIITI